jgi:hypothetical protein
MPNEKQRQALLDAVTQIRSAEKLLIQASRATADPVALTQISIEINQLDSFLSQLLHAQAISDDADFATAIAAFKQQAEALKADEDHIKKIVAAVGTGAQIVGYIAQALVIIAENF